MITKTVTLKEDTNDKVYSQFVDDCKSQNIFVACGNPDDKWVMIRFKNVENYEAWLDELVI